MQLSANFTLAEFERSDMAAKQGIDNRIPPELIGNVQRLVRDVLQPLRDVSASISISSGYRNPALNAAVGGSKTSQHCAALAADFTVRGQAPLQTCQIIADLDLPFDQLIHEFGRWVHVSVAPEGRAPRRQLLTIDKHGTRPGLLPVRA